MDVPTLTAKVNTLQAEVNRLTRALTTATSKESGLVDDLKQARARGEALEALAATRQKALETCLARNEEILKEEAARREAHSKSVEATIADVQAKIEAFTAESAEVRKENEALKKQIATLANAVTLSDKRNEASEKAHSLQVQLLEQEKLVAQQQAEKVIALATELSGKLKTSMAAEADARATNAELAEKVKDLQGMVNGNIATFKKTKKDMDALLAAMKQGDELRTALSAKLALTEKLAATEAGKATKLAGLVRTVQGDAKAAREQLKAVKAALSGEGEPAALVAAALVLLAEGAAGSPSSAPAGGSGEESGAAAAQEVPAAAPASE